MISSMTLLLYDFFLKGLHSFVLGFDFLLCFIPFPFPRKEFLGGEPMELEEKEIGETPNWVENVPIPFFFFFVKF